MEHPAFSEAGSEPGIEIWTIDKFEPAAIDRKMYGKFYNGDAYIVLKGAAAILTVTLDDMLGGKAVQHREVQGHETSQFLGYFKPAIRYLEGGNESGFTEVETNAGAEKRLLQLSGCDNMRIEEVPAEASSLTKDNCFILEVDHDIFVLVPEGAKATHRRKIISVANTLRDDYHNGRATIEIIDEFSSDEDIALFFEALGSGSKDDLADFQSNDGFSRASVSEVYLYKVLVGDEIELVAVSKPFRQKQLVSDEIYILDTPDSGLYIWLGQEVDPEVKKTYNDVAQKYLDVKEYPSWHHVTRVTEGCESSAFKQYFHNWETATDSTETDAGYASGDAEEEVSAYKIGKSAAARGYMPDQGEGELKVTRIAGDREDISDQAQTPVFYQNAAYVVEYGYSDKDGKPGLVVYVWMGSNAAVEDKLSAIELATEIEADNEIATVVKVPQGKEPRHLLSIFKGQLVILLGEGQSFKGSYDEDSVRLFKVEGTSELDTRAVQVPETADVLEDDDVFILETKDLVYVWNGKESDPQEQSAGQTFASRLVEGKDISVINQGDEPEEFWETLGVGAPEPKEDTSGWRTAASRRVTTPPTLTAVSVSVKGKIRFEELSPDFTQQDLSDDGVYILDGGEELYLWQGKNVPERVKGYRTDIVQEYIKDDGLERTADTALVVILKQGREPGVFKRKFPEWDDGMWDNQASYEDMKNEAKAANSK